MPDRAVNCAPEALFTPTRLGQNGGMGHARVDARDRPSRRRDGPKPDPGPLPKGSVADTVSPAVAVGLARAGGRLSVQQVASLQRAVGNAGVTAVLQRDEPTPAPHPAVNLDLGWLDDNAKVSTNGQIVAAAHIGIGTLESALADIESDQVKTDVQEWIDTVRGALPYFERHESEAINDGMVPLINHQIDRFAAIRAEIQDDKDSRLRAALNAELRAAEKAAEEAEAMQPVLAEAMRAAFRKGSSHTVKDTLSTVKTALSMGRSIRSLAGSITTDLSELANAVDTRVPALSVPSGTVMTVDRWSSQIGQVRVTVVNVGQYTEMLGTLGRGLAAINIAFTLADRSARATEAEQGMKDLNDVVNVSTDLASLSSASMPPHFSLMTALYIKPALKVISKQIGALVEQLSEENRVRRGHRRPDVPQCRAWRAAYVRLHARGDARQRRFRRPVDRRRRRGLSLRPSRQAGGRRGGRGSHQRLVALEQPGHRRRPKVGLRSPPVGVEHVLWLDASPDPPLTRARGSGLSPSTTNVARIGLTHRENRRVIRGPGLVALPVGARRRQLPADVFDWPGERVLRQLQPQPLALPLRPPPAAGPKWHHRFRRWPLPRFAPTAVHGTRQSSPWRSAEAVPAGLASSHRRRC